MPTDYASHELCLCASRATVGTGGAVRSSTRSLNSLGWRGEVNKGRGRPGGGTPFKKIRRKSEPRSERPENRVPNLCTEAKVLPRQRSSSNVFLSVSDVLPRISTVFLSAFERTASNGRGRSIELTVSQVIFRQEAYPSGLLYDGYTENDLENSEPYSEPYAFLRAPERNPFLRGAFAPEKCAPPDVRQHLRLSGGAGRPGARDLTL